jgi:diguanylate cyclase (GGDEF)-like protein/PAS domain S-box-containing protein
MRPFRWTDDTGPVTPEQPAAPQPSADGETARPSSPAASDASSTSGASDAAADRALDDLARLAAALCDAPAATISLLLDDRHWSSSTDLHELTRSLGLGTELVEVPDAHEDDRIAGDPLVAVEHGVRFYAGAPLVSTDGHLLGTLAVGDHVPRRLTAGQRDLLLTLARQAVSQLELRAHHRTAVEAEQRWRLLVESSPVGVAVCRTGDWRFLYANPQAAALYGCSADVLLGHSLLELVPDGSHEAAVTAFAGILDGTPMLGRESVLHAFDGTVRSVEFNASAIVFDGQPAMQFEFRDVTARVTWAEALRVSEARFRTLFSSAPIAVAEVRPDGILLDVNPALCQEFGYTPDELIGRPAAVLSEAAPGPMPGTAELFEDRDTRRSERTYIRKDGSRFPGSISAAAVRGPDGAVERVVGMILDISDQHAAREALRVSAEAHEQAALHDALTGLPNRVLLRTRLAAALERARSGGGHVTVLYCDLDEFKSVNDTFGHAAGDALLVAAAHRLGSALRPQDTLARLGGDEFVVLLDDTGVDPIVIARRLCEAISRPLDTETGGQPVTVSIGIATSRGELDPEQLLNQADSALYEAKRQGKDGWHAIG